MIAIYARQSIEKKDSVSIEAQIDKCKTFCNNNEYKIYKDVGYSGKNIDRPQFSNLIENIKAGLINKVIAYRLDRISRSIADFSQLLLLFEKYNVEFVSATENFDTTSPMGRAMINIVMTFAQLERETIVERVTDNYYFRANNGYWAGGTAPYGYKIKHIIGKDGKNHSILDEEKEQSKIVKKIYHMYVHENLSMRKITQHLNHEKIPTSKKGLWVINSVSAILSRPIYTPATTKIYNYYHNLNCNITNSLESFVGDMTSNLYGKAKKNTRAKARRNFNEMYLSLINCPPIISNDDWLKAQKRKGIMKYLPPRTNTSKISFLCGLIQCGKCGSKFVTQGCKNRYNIKYYYLICTSKRNLGTSVCNNKMVNVEELENIVISDIKSHFDSINLTKIIDTYVKNNNNKNIIAINQKEILENEIVGLNLKIEKLINCITESNEFSLRYINDKIKELEIEKQKKAKEISSLDLPDESQNDIIEYLKNLDGKLESNNIDELKKLCQTLIDKVIITDKNIDIHYKI